MEHPDWRRGYRSVDGKRRSVCGNGTTREMTINWQDVIVTVSTTVGGGAVLLSAAAWLIKTVLTNKLTRDIETFKARLKADGDIEIERLRSSLQKIAFEHQVRFSNLHERRAEMIAEIYAQMVEVEQCGQKFAFVDGFAEEEKRQSAYLETHKKLVDFYFFVEKRRLYLPKSVCALLTAFVDKVRKSVIGINIYVPIDAPYNPKLLEEKVKVVKDVFDAFEKSIPDARAALEGEFRHILGVEQ